MTPEQVVFPEPGRTLLHRAWRTLKEWLHNPGTGPGFVIGGGTMLAARWRHRNSKDLDVRVVETNGSALIVQMEFNLELQNRFDEAMQGTGAEHRQRINERQIVYAYGDPRDLRTPKIDLFEGPPKLRIPEIWSESEGMLFWSESNAEILAGKWKDRRSDLLIRDICDFAVAGLADGPALQQALTVDGDHQQIDEMIAQLAAAQETLKEEAKDETLGIPQELREIKEDPAAWAARSIGRWALSGIEIAREEGTWKVSTRCKATPEGAERARCETLKEAGERTAELSGFPAGIIAEMLEEADEEGGAARAGPRARMSAGTEPEMTVDAQGTVAIRDFGTAQTHAATIEAAADIAIERGWEKPARREEAIQALRVLQERAIQRGQEQTQTR